MKEKFINLDREDARLKAWLNKTKELIEQVAYECKPFSEIEITKVKDLVNNKWEVMNKKMATLSQEVFDQVMEQEMALARLETANFDKMIPNSQGNRSLLMRLNSLQLSLKAKQKQGSVPIYDHDEDQDESMQSSAIEEDSDEASSYTHKKRQNGNSNDQSMEMSVSKYKNPEQKKEKRPRGDSSLRKVNKKLSQTLQVDLDGPGQFLSSGVG